MLLKRPATIHQQDGLFVPDGVGMEEVDRRWEQLCNSNPACFDGTLLHVLGAQRNGCGGANVHVIPCSYRFFAVQDATYDLGVRTLGVKGITEFEGAYLFGKRSGLVRQYPDEWEFAPAGCVSPENSPERTIEKELLEETGLDLAAPPIAIAMIFDEFARTWELIFKLTSSTASVNGNDEYQKLEWLGLDNPPESMTPITEVMLRFI
ncbi:MAG: NUDIX domain-containing protein [Phycisphaerales bacterium]|jgi:8-oxo-dGTP pyrophosphatase MutT (NUDIX family)|nr:NUDIX domain-containing protein [Phycisphaerales bacterium]